MEPGVSIFMTLAVVGLLVYRATAAGGLWRDECGVVQMARMSSLREMADLFPLESFPLFYHLLMQIYSAWMGTSDVAMRGYGLAVGLILVGALWLNARWNGRGWPLFSLALLALQPTFLVWGTTVRGYGLGCVAIVLALAFTARMLHDDSWKVRLGALTASILSVQLLLYNAALLLAVGLSAAIILALANNRPRAWTVLGIGALSAASLLPYAGAYLRGGDWAVLVRQDVSWNWLWRDFVATLGIPAPWAGWVWIGLFLGMTGWIVFLGLSRPWKTTPVAGVSWLAVGSVMGGLGFFFAFLLLMEYGPRPWYYLAPISLAAACLDLFPATLGSMALFRLARIGVALAALGVAAYCVLPVLQVRQTNMDEVARRLGREAEAGDYIVVHPWYMGVSFNWYYQGPAPWSTLPVLSDHRIHRYDLFKAAMSADKPIEGALVAMERSLQSGHRVWVVGGLPFPDDVKAPRAFPPPHDRVRWSEGDYSYAWGSQAASLLKKNALEGEVLPSERPYPVNQFECIDLLRFRGWRIP
jgi:hypothetical protein